MNELLTQRLERAVLDVYQAINKRDIRTSERRSEEYLWHELVSCILGSKVPFEQAQAAANLLIDGSLLDVDDCRRDGLVFESHLVEALMQPITSTPVRSGRSFKYRYPRLRANHIRRTSESIYNNNGSITSILSSSSDPRRMRVMVMNASVGIGPKQASLFLRNIGFTDSLAILDAHVLRYMFLTEIIRVRTQVISAIGHYQEVEDHLKAYTNRLGANLAFLDTAIWVTMRVFQQEVAL